MNHESQTIDPANIAEFLAKLEAENDAANDIVELLPTQAEREAQMERMLTQEIPPREFIFDQSIIPKGELTLAAGFNGSSKSFLALQIAVSKAVGKSIMIDDEGNEYFKPMSAGKVLILSVEDDQNDYGRRLQGIVKQLIEPSDPHLKRVIKENLYFNSFGGLGVSGQLVRKNAATGIIQPTEDYQRLKASIVKENFELVIIDPFHYVLGAITENCNEEGGQGTGLMIDLAKASGAAILCPAHTSEGNPLKVRGGTSITDRARSVLSIATLGKLYEKRSSISVSIPKQANLGEYKNRPHDVIRFGMVKNSHGKILPKYYLFVRGTGGVLKPITIEHQETQTNFSSIIPEAINSYSMKQANQTQIVEYIQSKNLDGGLSIRTLKKRITEFEASGLIELVEGTTGSSKYYQVARQEGGYKSEY